MSKTAEEIAAEMAREASTIFVVCSDTLVEHLNHDDLRRFGEQWREITGHPICVLSSDARVVELRGDSAKEATPSVVTLSEKQVRRIEEALRPKSPLTDALDRWEADLVERGDASDK